MDISSEDKQAKHVKHMAIGKFEENLSDPSNRKLPFASRVVVRRGTGTSFWMTMAVPGWRMSVALVHDATSGAHPFAAFPSPQISVSELTGASKLDSYPSSQWSTHMTVFACEEKECKYVPPGRK